MLSASELEQNSEITISDPMLPKKWKALEELSSRASG